MTRRSLLRRTIYAPVAAAAGLTVARTVPAAANQGHFMAVPASKYAAYRAWSELPDAIKWNGLGFQYLTKEELSASPTLAQICSNRQAKELEKEMLARLT